MRILLLPPFDVPDALDDIAARLDARVVLWPPAASCMPPDQEVGALPAGRRCLAVAEPELIVGVDNAANTAARLAGETDCRLLLIDPWPKLPGIVSSRQAAEALDEVMGQVDLAQLAEEMAEAEDREASEVERAAIYLRFLERDVLPLIDDPHQRRQAESRLRVHRRDGMVAKEPESLLSPWYQVIREPALVARSSVVLTSQADQAEEWATLHRAAGVSDARSVPMAQPWWWTDPIRAMELITAMTLGSGGEPS